MKPSLPPKKDVALALVEKSSVYLYLDPRRDGVVVPPWFRRQPELILQVGLDMAIPIPDLRFDDEGVSATLSFKGSQFFCVVPWPAVFAMRGEDGRGMIWPDDLPPEMYAHAKSGAAAEGEPPVVAPVKREGPRAVPSPKADKAPKAEAKDAEPKAAKKKGKSKKSDGPVQRELPLDVVPAPAEAAKGPRPAPRPAPAAASTLKRPEPQAGGPRRPKRELPPYLRVVK